LRHIIAEQFMARAGSHELKKQISEYWSNGADGYNKYVLSSLQPGVLKKRWQEILRESIGDERMMILDVGTGPGIIAILLADMGHRVTGLDLTSEMLNKARENTERLGLSIEFKQGDAENIPFEDGSFDVVINRHVLWTMPKPDAAIKEWKRVLRPEGKLVIVDGNWYLPLDSSLKNRIWQSFAKMLVSIQEKRNAFYRRGDPGLRKMLPMTFMKRPEHDVELLKRQGFKDINVRTIDRRSFGFIEYLKYGYYGDTFLISARKGKAE